MDLFNSYLDRQLTLNSMAKQFSADSGQQFMRTNTPMSTGGGLSKGSGLNQESTSGLSDATFKKRNKPVQQEMKTEAKKAIEAEEEVDEDGDIKLSGTVGGGVADQRPAEEKHNDTVESPKSSKPQGFSKLIDDFGQEFANSRSRKSVVFVPNDKTLPLKGWKSLRNAGLNSKKLGKITKNGDNFAHTTKDGSQGSMYLLNTNAWKSLRRKKTIQIDD
jgi:hypothetical protein